MLWRVGPAVPLSEALGVGIQLPLLLAGFGSASGQRWQLQLPRARPQFRLCLCASAYSPIPRRLC